MKDWYFVYNVLCLGLRLMVFYLQNLQLLLNYLHTVYIKAH